jgi:3-hydroxy-5-phosphonooxypentane-2,4-dione thiolase
MGWGMKNRLSRLIQADGRCFFLPIDYGYFQGPTRKLEKPGQTIKPLIKKQELTANHAKPIPGR